MRGAILLGCVLVVGCGKPVDNGGGTSPPVEVTADRLYKDYQGNIATADAKYVGRTLKVSGRVLEVEKWGDGYAVGIETGPNIMPSGHQLKAAVVAAVSRDDAAKLKDFDEVTVEGRFAAQETDPGRMGGLLLKLDAARVTAHTPKKK